jgi:hypothetical protein
MAATPLRARFVPSVAPLVKMISLPVAPIRAGDLVPGFLDGGLGLPPERVAAAGRVPELLGEVRQHRLDHPRVGPGGRVVVQVDRQLDGHVRSDS